MSYRYRDRVAAEGKGARAAVKQGTTLRQSRPAFAFTVVQLQTDAASVRIHYLVVSKSFTD